MLTSAGIPVLVVTGCIDEVRLGIALEQGAAAVLRKDVGFEHLLRAVRDLLAGHAVPSVPAADRLRAALSAHRDERTVRLGPYLALTERERQVLAALADGRTVNDIAGKWVVSAATVRSHVQSVLTKLGVGSQLQAVVLAVRSGWLEPV